MIVHIPVNFKNEIPSIFEQQNKSTEIVYAIYYVENSDWKWFILEYSSLQKLFYGYLEPDGEYQYFSISDLQKIAYEYGVEIELDNNLNPISLKELL